MSVNRKSYPNRSKSEHPHPAQASRTRAPHGREENTALAQRIDKLFTLSKKNDTAEYTIDEICVKLNRYDDLKAAICFLEKMGVPMDATILENLMECAARNNDLGALKRLFKMGKDILNDKHRNIFLFHGQRLGCDEVVRENLDFLKNKEIPLGDTYLSSLMNSATRLKDFPIMKRLYKIGEKRGALNEIHKYLYLSFGRRFNYPEVLNKGVSCVASKPSLHIDLLTQLLTFVGESNVNKTKKFEMLQELIQIGKDKKSVTALHQKIFLDSAIKLNHPEVITEGVSFLAYQKINTSPWYLSELMHLTVEYKRFDLLVELFKIGFKKGVSDSNHLNLFRTLAMKFGTEEAEKAEQIIKEEKTPASCKQPSFVLKKEQINKDDPLIQRIDKLLPAPDSKRSRNVSYRIDEVRRHLYECKTLADALSFLEKHHLPIDHITLNALLKCCTKSGSFEYAAYLFDRGNELKLVEIIPHSISFLECAYASGHYACGKEELDRLIQNGEILTPAALHILMKSADKNGDFEELHELYKRGHIMKIITPSHRLFFLLSGCRLERLEVLNEGMSFLENASTPVTPDDLTQLIPFFGNTGNVNLLKILRSGGRNRGILTTEHGKKIRQYIQQIKGDGAPGLPQTVGSTITRRGAPRKQPQPTRPIFETRTQTQPKLTHWSSDEEEGEVREERGPTRPIFETRTQTQPEPTHWSSDEEEGKVREERRPTRPIFETRTQTQADPTHWTSDEEEGEVREERGPTRPIFETQTTTQLDPLPVFPNEESEELSRQMEAAAEFPWFTAIKKLYETGKGKGILTDQHKSLFLFYGKKHGHHEVLNEGVGFLVNEKLLSAKELNELCQFAFKAGNFEALQELMEVAKGRGQATDFFRNQFLTLALDLGHPEAINEGVSFLANKSIPLPAYRLRGLMHIARTCENFEILKELFEIGIERKIINPFEHDNLLLFFGFADELGHAEEAEQIIEKATGQIVRKKTLSSNALSSNTQTTTTTTTTQAKRARDNETIASDPQGKKARR